jgi:hypothetical protein
MNTTVSAAVICAAVMGLLAWSSPPAAAKTAKECNAEWAANKASIQASGKTKKVYVAECRGLPPPTDKVTLGKGQFKTEAEAKTSCPTDTVVWVNLRSKVYHTSESKSYGKTKRGAYMCEKESTAAGFHAPKAPRAPKKPV